MKYNLSNILKALTIVFTFLLSPVQSYATWSSDNTVNNAISNPANMQYNPHIVTDGSDGAIITWEDYRNGNSDIFAQRIDAAGTVQWTVNGVALTTAAGNQTKSQIVSDGSGGAIITWQDERNGNLNPDIYAQRIDANGTVIWAANGVAIATNLAAQYYPQLVSDGSGGAIVTWVDMRSTTGGDIYAQRVAANGSVEWAAEGVAVCTATTTFKQAPQIVADGSGGALIVWYEQGRSGSYYKIYGQRINSNGTPNWAINGLNLSGINDVNQWNFSIAGDGSGGVFICWIEGASGPTWNIAAQRISGSGSKSWGSYGLVTATFSTYNTPRNLLITGDGLGGAIFAWTDDRTGASQLYARRATANGVVQWAANGTLVYPSAAGSPQIISDGNNGAILTWTDATDTMNRNIFAQRYDLNGNFIWWTAVAMATGNQEAPQIVSAGNGKNIIAWTDYRNASTAPDIYAQKLLANGSLPVRYQLTAAAAGNGSGSVASSIGGISYTYPATNAGTAMIDSGDAVTLTATAATGSMVAWTGNCGSLGGGSTAATCTIENMDAAKTVTATFSLKQYDLTANAAGNGAGSVVSSTGGINFTYPAANSAAATLNYGTPVTLTATAAANSTVAWSGNCDSTGGSATVATCTVSSMVAARTVTATFNTYLLTVRKTESGRGEVAPDSGTFAWNGNTGSGSYRFNTSVTLTASPTDSTFGGWNGCDSTNGNQCTVTMTAAKSVTATFYGSWASDPRQNTPISTATREQSSSHMASDGSGGTIITWVDNRSGTRYDIYAQRVDANGIVMWTYDGVAIATGNYDKFGPRIASDGSGGAFIAWYDRRNGEDNWDIFAQRIDGNGISQWIAEGVAICTAPNGQDDVKIVGDGSGGAIISWKDYRNDARIYTQRVDGNGAVQWAANGIEVCPFASTQQTPEMVSDGSGGAIIGWMDYRNNKIDFYAQRVAGTGALLWAADGLYIGSYPVGNPIWRTMTGDGAGGAIFAWGDTRNGDTQEDLYAQRVDASGTRQWTVDGLAISTVTATPRSYLYPRIAAADGGGAIVTWQDTRSGNYVIYTQKIADDGTLLWNPVGVALTSETVNRYQPIVLAEGGNGGAIIAWTDGGNLYAQRVNATGTPEWTSNGVPFATSDCQKSVENVISDGNSGAIFAWTDYRTCINRELDIYAQKLSADGMPAVRTDTTAPTVTAFGIPTLGTTAAIDITRFTASDNVAVTSFCLSETDSSSGCTWVNSAPASYTFSGIPVGIPTSKTLYAWARDAAGNVSASVAGSITITIPDNFAPTITAFSIPSTSSAVAISITRFTADDNVVVTAYCLTETNSSSGCSWNSSAPTGYSFSNIPDGIATDKTLYAWARDLAGNISISLAASITIILPDITVPTVTAFSIPATSTSASISIASFTATDNVAVTGYCLTETNSSSGCTWQGAAPVSYVFSGVPDGIATARPFYAWARDAAGNISASVASSVNITLPDSTVPTVTAFTIPATSNSFTIPITTFTATDNVAVNEYCLSETNNSSGCVWNAAKPASFTVSGEGSITIFAWARDAAGNSSAGAQGEVTVTIAKGDINGDGVTSIVDVLTIYRSIVLGIPLTPAEIARADLAPVGAPNGVVDINDVIIMLRKLVGL